LTIYFHIDFAISFFFIPVELGSFDMTINNSLQRDREYQTPKGAEVKLISPSNWTQSKHVLCTLG